MPYQKELDFTKALIKQAGELAKSMQNEVKSHFKTENDVVTEADFACEKLIVEAIQNAFPDDQILAEENFNKTTITDERLWVIDPIDGTLNYDRGMPLYAISIALVEKGESVVGCIYLPAFDELYFAQIGGGAFCNEEKIEVSSVDEISKSIVHTNSGYNQPVFEGAGGKSAAFTSICQGTMRTRIIGCAALEVAYVASGKIEAYACDAFYWDFAAGMVIVEEAGGKATRSNGEPYNPRERDIVFSNGLIHEGLLGLLNS